MSENDAVVSKWTEVRGMIEGLELDVHKNAKGNAAAGVRTRKGLRTLRKKVTELVKMTVALDKDRKSEKAATKASTPPTA